jgi:drug/metabolite transporter (DMT)-like permease
MTWLVIAILAYLIFALVSLGDRFLLLGAPEPKTYTFYVGLLGIISVVLIPFVGFSVPPLGMLLFCFFAALNYILFLYLMYSAIEKYEVSRIIPAVGALVPLISFLIIFLLSGVFSPLGIKGIISFLLLVVGSVIVNADYSKAFSLKSLKICFTIALFASLGFIFSKYAFMHIPFWTAFIWTRIFTFVIALFFILSLAVRKEIFGKKKSFTKKETILFVGVQIFGALAFVLQNWAIALAGFAYLPIVNALQGVQYLFLFIFALLIALKVPKAIKEDLSKKAIFQKILAMAIMVVGFILLAYN